MKTCIRRNLHDNGDSIHSGGCWGLRLLSGVVVPMSNITEKTCRYCFLDFDVDNHRKKLATAAAFVANTDSRYAFSSKDHAALKGTSAGGATGQ